MDRRSALPTAPGRGRMRITVPMAALLDRDGPGVEAYLRHVRSGHLDRARRSTKFSSAPEEMSAFQERGTAPAGPVPDLSGDVTWRRALGVWSLDVAHAKITPAVHWWEMRPKGRPTASMRVDGLSLPESVVGEMVGRPLREFVEHHALADERIVVRSATCYGPTTFAGRESPASTQFELDAPYVEFDDPVPFDD